jgi:hypothetical protein
MITKRQAILQLRKKIQEQHADTGYTNQFLYLSILEQAKWIVKREIRSGRVYKNMDLFKPLKCKRVVESSIIENSCPIKIPCNIWRTDKKLPDTWQDDYGPVIKYAMSVDDSTRWHLISKEEWINKQSSPYFKLDKTKYMIYSDGYLWFPRENPKRINIYGYWIDDPLLYSECGDKPQCIKYLDTPLYIPDWTEAEIINKAFEILIKGTKQIPLDEDINKSENRK